MDFAMLTVKELRDYAAVIGVEIPKGSRKAEIIALLEADVTPTQTVDSPQDLAIAFTPAPITANLDAISAKVDAILAQYDGWVPDANNKDDVSQCSAHRKYLNGLVRQIDERRKAVKAEYTRPLNDFEAAAKDICSRIKGVSDKLKAVEEEADLCRRGKKRGELADAYLDYAGALAPLVEYEKLHEERWLNKTYSIVQAKEDLYVKVDRIAKDWETLKNLNLPYQNQAELYFFEHLDLAAAVQYAQKLSSDAEALKELYKVTNDSGEPAAAQEPACADEVGVIEAADEADERFEAEELFLNSFGFLNTEKMKSIAYVVSNAVRFANNPRHHFVMVCDPATVEAMQAIGAICGAFGVTGMIKRGTIGEVCARG